MNVTLYVAYKTPKGEYEVFDVTELSTVTKAFRVIECLQDIAAELGVQFRVELYIRKGRDC